ncbi:MAG: RNA 2',3'-cyclic phosphodiesterase [Pirellulaceae bacterium]
MDTSRVFVAIELDMVSAGSIARLVKGLQANLSDVRWSRPEQLHLTLKFIGEVDNRELPQFCNALRDACAGIEPFSLELSGLGAFPKNKPPRVVWVSAEDPHGMLGKLAERLDERMVALGVPREKRAFTPHLTLGRVARGADLPRLQQAMEAAAQVSIRCEVEELVLLSSVKEQGKVLYEALDRVALEDAE